MSEYDFIYGFGRVSNVFGDGFDIRELEVYEISISFDRSSVEIKCRTSAHPIKYPAKWKASYLNTSISFLVQMIDSISLRQAPISTDSRFSVKKTGGFYMIEIVNTSGEITIQCSDVSVIEMHQF